VNDEPALTIVVPTRDRPDALKRCLGALARQTAPSLEIVVIDDGSRDPGAVRAAVARACPAARVVRGAGRGPAAARNLGVRAARGAAVCFTDDDCRPGPDWAARLVAACAGDGAAAGMTVADPASGRCAAAAQLLTHALQVGSLHPDGKGLGFAPTCNLACATELARALPFDESFPLAAGEDRDWCARLVRAGARLSYVPAASVVHAPRLGLRGLLRQQWRYGRGAVRFRRAGGGLAGPAYYTRLVRACARAGAHVTGLVALAQAAVAAGAIGELAARARSAR
jgi:glycosyltransferase involved in cell wall biosynthesis